MGFVFDTIFTDEFYYTVVVCMMALSPVVFLALLRVRAGYGSLYTPRWGATVNNRLGWFLMEIPVVAVMLMLWLMSPRRTEAAPAVMTSLFLLHYVQRSIVFPLLIKGKGKMPWTIIIMGAVFNIINAYMIGGWFFYVAPAGTYASDWLLSPAFITGTLVFFAGMWINIRSDSIIRNLRKPGDTGHYIPHGGMFRYVTSANYFGEFTEWVGFAILSWSLGGAVFALWTFANLAPRARALHQRYEKEFGAEYATLRRKYIIPGFY